MHVCMNSRVSACMYVCMHACMNECMYVCMYACINVSMYVCTYVCMFVHMHVYVCVCFILCVSCILTHATPLIFMSPVVLHKHSCDQNISYIDTRSKHMRF